MAEPAAAPPPTLEAEVWAVQQELKAATEKLDRLSAALDQVRASGGSQDEIDDLLEDKKVAREVVRRLNEELRQLSKKRNLELNREELELDTEKHNRELERERAELELKKQRIELEEQEQKLAEARFGSALEWVQATQPCKVPPPGPPDVLMPSDNTIPRIARRREMRKIWRLLRKAARKGRIPVSFLHGGPGAGKTFTAYHLMKKSNEDIAKLAYKDPELYDFAQATQFVAISFNNTTPVQEGRESRWMKEYNPDFPQSRRNLFMPVTARLLYQFVNDRQLGFPSFCDSLEDAVTRKQIDASMLDLHQVIGTVLPGHDGPLVLIVDELAKLDKGNDRGIAEQMRSALCGAMNESFLILFTSLSDEIMKKEFTASHRAVETIPLSALPATACAQLFYKELRKKTLVDSNHRQEIDKWDMAWSMARMCWGHPRSLEVLVSALRSAAPYERVHNVIGEAVGGIRANYASITSYPINVLKLVLLAVNVKLNDEVRIRPDLPPVQWDDLIASGYLVNSTADTSFMPHISELMLRAIVDVYASPEVTPPEARRLIQHLRLLLGLLGFNFDWRLFEKLNLYWELVHRDCTGMRPDLFAAISVKDYYKTPYAKGTLTETLINVVGPLDTERAFPELDGRVLVPGPNTPGLTMNVWYPGVDNFPGLDSVYFVLKAGGAGILPLVFQVKYSDHEATTVLDRKTVETAYANTKKAMEEAGWTEFVLIVSAWREVAKNLLKNPPDNVMILTKNTLTQQFGCLGAVVKTIHLRDVFLDSDAPPGASGDDEVEDYMGYDDEEDEDEGEEHPSDEQKQML